MERTSGSRQPAVGVSRIPARNAPIHWAAAWSPTAAVLPSPSSNRPPNPIVSSEAPPPALRLKATRVRTTPTFSKTGAAAASAKRPRLFWTAAPIPARP